MQTYITQLPHRSSRDETTARNCIFAFCFLIFIIILILISYSMLNYCLVFLRDIFLQLFSDIAISVFKMIV